jgi:MSHA biogenesis protein MshJ
VKALLKRIAERIDAASLRERVLIFLALTALLVFVVNAALIEPMRVTQKRLTAEAAQREKELQAVQAQIARMVQSAAVDPNAANRARLATLQSELAQLDARIAQEQSRFTPPERMRAVLEEMLQRNKGLALVELNSLPVAPIGSVGTAGDAALYRHGIEFTVTGTYLELYEYLRALERLPTQLYWRRAELIAGEYPVATLRLTLFTVSFDRAWLIV